MDYLNESFLLSEAGASTVKAGIARAEAEKAAASFQGGAFSLLEIYGDTAVLNVIGPVFSYNSLLTQITGWPSAEGLLADVEKAESDPQVRRLVLRIDSPGGQVGGITELAGYIRETVDMPVIAYVADTAASGSYWIASAADEIVAADTAELGSIGVVFLMRPKADSTIEIISSMTPLKRPNPGTDAGRKVLQERVDNLAGVFIKNIAKYRNLSADKIRGLKGNMVIAQKAVDVGLADRIGSLHELLNGDTAAGSNDFDELVSAYHDKHGGKRSQAIQAVAASRPDLHKAWLTAQQRQKIRPAPAKIKNVEAAGDNFRALVDEYTQKHGVKKSQAITVIAGRHPDLHEAFIRASQ